MAVSSIGDTYFTNYSTEANDAVSQKMTSQIQDAETDEEMLDACKQFESYLVQQMFKSMEESAKVFSDDDEDNSNDYVNMFQDNYLSAIADQMVNLSLIHICMSVPRENGKDSVRAVSGFMRRIRWFCRNFAS